MVGGHRSAHAHLRQQMAQPLNDKTRNSNLLFYKTLLFSCLVIDHERESL